MLKSPRSLLGRMQQPLRVQLIDGDPVARLRIADYLRAAGLAVQDTADACGALVQMWQARPDVVVLDPAVLYSRTLMHYCRRDTHLQAVPLLLLSRGPNLGRAVQDLGARAGLAKPMDLDVLLAVLTCVAGCGARRPPHVPQGFGRAARLPATDCGQQRSWCQKPAPDLGGLLAIRG